MRECDSDELITTVGEDEDTYSSDFIGVATQETAIVSVSCSWVSKFDGFSKVKGFSQLLDVTPFRNTELSKLSE